MLQSQPLSRSCRTAKTCWRWCKPDLLQLIVNQSTTNAFLKLTPNSAYFSDSFSLRYNEFSEDVFEKLDECDKIQYWRWITPLRITDCNLMDGWYFYMYIYEGICKILNFWSVCLLLNSDWNFIRKLYLLSICFAYYHHLVLHFSNILLTLICCVWQLHLYVCIVPIALTVFMPFSLSVLK